MEEEKKREGEGGKKGQIQLAEQSVKLLFSVLAKAQWCWEHFVPWEAETDQQSSAVLNVHLPIKDSHIQYKKPPPRRARLEACLSAFPQTNHRHILKPWPALGILLGHSSRALLPSPDRRSSAHWSHCCLCIFRWLSPFLLFFLPHLTLKSLIYPKQVFFPPHFFFCCCWCCWDCNGREDNCQWNAVGVLKQ